MNIPFKKYLKKHKISKFDIKAILYDMDGVLYDSMKWHAKSWKQTMDEYNINSSENEFYMYEGMVGHKTIASIIKREERREASVDEIEEIYKRKSALFVQMNQGLLIDFAYDMVKKVDGMGLKSVIVTGSGQPSLLNELDTSFDGVFTKDKIITAHDVKYGKPNPEPYLMGLERGGMLKPHQGIVIENAPLGVEASVAAEIFTIAINTGPLNPQILHDAGADIVLSSMEDLYHNFDEYFKILKENSIDHTPEGGGLKVTD